MSSNVQKTPLSRALPRISQQKIYQEFARRGGPLPCHVTSVQWPMVTVNFDVEDVLLDPVQVVPVHFQYINVPIQVGEKGWVFPCPLYMGSITGLGPPQKLANLNVPELNMSALMFFPAANTNWEQPDNINATTIWGPEGVELQDVAGNAPNYSLKVNSDGINLVGGGFSIQLTLSTIKMSGGGHSVEINSTGILMDGHPYADHEHQAGTYVAGSTAVTLESGIVVPGT